MFVPGEDYQTCLMFAGKARRLPYMGLPERCSIEVDYLGLYYKTIRARNVRQMHRFCSKLASFILSVKNTLALTNTLACYEICTLWISHVFIVKAQVVERLSGDPL